MQSDNHQTLSGVELKFEARPRKVKKLRNSSKQSSMLHSSEHAGYLPESKYRHAAGHVSRRNDNPTPVEPPPSNPRQANPTIPTKDSGQGRKSTRKPGHGSGSDSDSDSDQDRRRNGDEDDVVTVPKKPIVGNTEFPSLADLEISRDGKAAASTALKNIESSWGSIEQKRHQNRKDGRTTRQRLLRRPAFASFFPELALSVSHNHIGNNHPGLSLMLNKTKDWEIKTRLFLDTALCQDLERLKLEKRLKIDDRFGGGKPQEYFEDVIERLETEVISRLDTFRPSNKDREWDTPNIKDELVQTFMRLYHLLGSGIPKKDRTESVAKYASRLMKDNCQTILTPRNIDRLVDTYLEKIVDGFIVVFLSRQGLSQELREMGRFKDPHEIGRFKELHGTERVEELHIIKNSRLNDRFTSAYMNWVREGVDQSLLKQCCLEMQQEIRAKTVQKLSLRQEFVQNVDRLKGVSLVLLRKNYPIAIRDVSYSDLQNMGWQIDSKGAYWKYEAYRDENSKGTGDVVFTVSMEEEVLALWKPV